MNIEQFAKKHVPVNRDGFIRDFLILKECSDDLSIREFLGELDSLIDDYGVDHKHKRELFALSLLE